MNTARIHQLPNRRPRSAAHGITVAQFRALKQALRDLPPADWRNEAPAYPLPARRLIPADPSYFPF